MARTESNPHSQKVVRGKKRWKVAPSTASILALSQTRYCLPPSDRTDAWPERSMLGYSSAPYSHPRNKGNPASNQGKGGRISRPGPSSCRQRNSKRSQNAESSTRLNQMRLWNELRYYLKKAKFLSRGRLGNKATRGFKPLVTNI